MKPIRTWILIADGARARIFQRDGRSGPLTPATDHDFARPLMPSREIISDKPGRGQGANGSHGMPPRVDAHEQEKQDFAREVAQFINGEVGKNRFDELIVVAPPKTLGDLRGDFSDQARSRIRGELGKDLTHLPVHELPDHLARLQ